MNKFFDQHSFFTRHNGLLVLGFWLLDTLAVRNPSWFLDSLDGKRFWVNQLLSLGFAWGLLWLSKGRSVLFRGLVTAFVGLALYLQTAYFAVYEKLIGVFDIRFFMADPIMALGLYAENGSAIKPLLVAILGTGLVWRLLSGSAHHLGRFQWKGWSIATLSSSIFFLLTVNWYSAPNLQITPVSLASAVAKLTDVRVGKNTATIEKPSVPAVTNSAQGPSVVWVIGESVNKSHLGVYGYSRDTTPFLSSLVKLGQAMVFEDAVAVGPRTMVSVPYLLTGLQNVDPHGRIYTVPTIFNYAKAAGYQTALITSQDFQWRNVDKLFVDRDLNFFRQGSDFSPDVNVSVGANDHDVLKRGILPWLHSLKTNQEPFLLVTQMSGSHPPFGKQVPQANKRFLPEENPNGINAYDNTIVYTDGYLEKLVTAARKLRPNTWVFFTTDHGTHVTGQGNKFHGDLGDPVIRVPLIVIPPADAMKQIKAQKNSPVAHADIMASVLDLMQIQPVAPIDGVSWLKEQPKERLRISTSYVITLHNDPVAALFVNASDRFEVNFDTRSVTDKLGKTSPFANWAQRYQDVFEPWLSQTPNKLP